MTASFQTRKTCRLCHSAKLTPGLPMQPTPIGDNYVTADGRNEREEIFNLDLFLCEDCGQVQLRDVVSPDLLYPAFPYVTSVSVGLPEHFRKFAEDLMNQHRIAADSLVVEIGSNEGPMLRAFKERGCRVLGIEPAAEIARAATNAGVPTLARYFTKELAREVQREHGYATVIAANNVLANIDDLDAVMQGFKLLLARDGILVMETSYWRDVVGKGLIDTIYHEHISYFSVVPLQAFFHRHGLQLIDSQWNSNKGGSIRLTVQWNGGTRAVNPSVAQQIAIEQREQIHALATLATCRRRLDELTGKLQKALGDFQREGKSVMGYGASVGTTTMLYEFKLGSLVKELFDDNTRKHGKFSPGLHIPCVPAGKLDESRPDYVVVFAWRYLEQIQKKHPRYGQGQGHYVLPLPELKII
ncbi:MAG: class I SAM-dependent methyltransferase [Verrucomicrobia bacterium]|nr:class I SAM-dependent methyltransferase [Verrucomicrobiota bacterium]